MNYGAILPLPVLMAALILTRRVMMPTVMPAPT